MDTLSDTYTAAQMAYALALAGSNRLNDVMATLESLATNQGKKRNKMLCKELFGLFCRTENAFKIIILISLLN